MPRPDIPIPVIAATLASSGLFTLALLLCLKAIPGLDIEARRAGSGRGADPWRLRPGDDAAWGSSDPSPPRLRLAEGGPEERRIVRVVYPGLTGPR